MRFTGSWNIILCTKRSVVGLLGGHYSEWTSSPGLHSSDEQGTVFHCDETLVIYVRPRSRTRLKLLLRCWPLPAELTRQRKRRGKCVGQTDRTALTLFDRLLNIFQQVDLTKNFYFRCVTFLTNEFRLTRLLQLLIRPHEHSSNQPHPSNIIPNLQSTLYVEPSSSGTGI